MTTIRSLAVLISLSALMLFMASFPGHVARAASAEELALPHSRARLIAEYQGLPIGETAFIGLLIQLDPRWHTYWKNPGDSGAAPVLNYSASVDGVSFSEIIYPQPERIETGPLVSFGYHGEVLFMSEVSVPAGIEPGTTVKVRLEGEYLVCEEICVPAFFETEVSLRAEVSAELSPSANFEVFQKNRLQLPLTVEGLNYSIVKAGGVAGALHIDVEIPSAGALNGEIEPVDFFPSARSGIGHLRPSFERLSEQTIRIISAQSSVPATDESEAGVLLFRRPGGERIESLQVAREAQEQAAPFQQVSAGGLVFVLVSAFLGGLILNLMPCVFPIVSMKLLGLSKLASVSRREVRALNLSYAAGVLVTFLSMALLLLVIRASGEAVGWGFQMQSPVFVLALIVLFAVLALNFLGVFEFDFFDTGLGDHLTRHGGLKGSFFTGVLSVVIASPCTAPFMGAAIGFAISQSVPVLLSIFFSLGLGLASPYLVFVIWPSVIGCLPRPGAWMVTFKEFMAFPMLATALWLLWVLSYLTGIDTAFTVAGAVLTLSLAIWALGRLRKSQERTRTRNFGMAFAGLLLLASLAFALKKVNVIIDPSGVDTGTRDSSGMDWLPFSPEQVESLRANGQTVFVNFTAAWCLTCKVNERVTFADRAVQSFVRENSIVMLKADWTRRDPVITKTLEAYGRIGVPFYLLFPAGGGEARVLPEVLTPALFMDAVKSDFREK